MGEGGKEGRKRSHMGDKNKLKKHRRQGKTRRTEDTKDLEICTISLSCLGQLELSGWGFERRVQKK